MNRSLIIALCVILVPLKSLCNKLYYELSFTYPQNIITIGAKHSAFDILVGISYNHSQKRYFFTSESSSQSNPCIVQGINLLINEMNNISKPYKKNLKNEALIDHLHKKASLTQKSQSIVLNTNLKNILPLLKYLDKDDPTRLEIENRLKSIEG